MFGSKHYGEIYGYVNLSVYLGTALSVPAVAMIFDKTGSYQVAWFLCIALIMISLVALLYSDIKCHSLKDNRENQQSARNTSIA
ncbi:MFS transporter [Desulfosporosinus orientis]|uniref:MFS transporter n=1 Tax=Desulfosporosinus orientis TaxID=1563 RepID=UPI0011D2C15D|nr:MFS transporter [Desulfosporosinus orientis]